MYHMMQLSILFENEFLQMPIEIIFLNFIRDKPQFLAFFALKVF